MTTFYTLRATASDLTGDDSEWDRALSEGGGAQGTENFNAHHSGPNHHYGFTEADAPADQGVTGDYSVPIYVEVGDTTSDVRVRLARVDASGAVQDESDYSDDQALDAGLQTHVFTNLDLGTWQPGDRLRIHYEVSRSSGMGSSSATLRTGSGTGVEAPWTLDAPDSPATGGATLSSLTSLQASGSAPEVPDALGGSELTSLATFTATGGAPTVGGVSGGASLVSTSALSAAGTAPEVPEASGGTNLTSATAFTAAGLAPAVGGTYGGASLFSSTSFSAAGKTLNSGGAGLSHGTLFGGQQLPPSSPEVSISAPLHAARRQVWFTYDVLDAENRRKYSLVTVTDGWIRHDAEAEIKRIARFTIVGQPIDWLQDRIAPYMNLALPGGESLAFPLGVFIPSSPTRTIVDGSLQWRVECYDQLQILREERLGFEYIVEPGVRITDYIRSLLDGAGITDKTVAPSDKVVASLQHFDLGSSRLDVINDLLDQLNYESLFFDAQGRAVVREHTQPEARNVSHTYRSGQESVTFDGFAETLDLFDVPNQWTLVVSRPNEAPMKAEYSNIRMDSPTSIPRRGRIISRFDDTVEAPDQETLDSKVRRRAFEESQAYGDITFHTALMPTHGHSNMLGLNFFGTESRYVETSWEMPLRPGARMTHTARRVVPV